MELEGSDNSAETPPIPEDKRSLSQFIENMGLHYQDYGIPRIGGRIIGLLLVTPRPVSSEEMAEALQVSRSSVSTNLRTLLMTDLVEKVSLPGDRLDYYTLADDPWQKTLEMRLAAILPLKEVAEEGLDGLRNGSPIRQRLEEMITWVDMVEEMTQRMRQEWQSRQELPAGSG